MTRITMNNATIQSIDVVTNITYFIPMGAFILVFIGLIVVFCIHTEWLKKLASWSSGGYFEVVQELTAIPKARNDQDDTSTQPRVCLAQRLRILGRLLKVEYQNSFMVIYVLFTLPLQASIIVILFIQNIFTEEFTSENCYRYLDFFRHHDDLYSCHLKNYIRHHSLNDSYVDMSNVTSYCVWQNGTDPMASEDLVCRVFLFDKSKLIVSVGAVYGWHKLLALFSLVLIHWQLYWTRKIRDKYLYYTVVCVPPGLLFCAFFIAYVLLTDVDTFSITKALSGSVGLSILIVSMYYTSKSFFRTTNLVERRTAPNFSTAYIIVRPEETETLLMNVQND